MFVIIFGFDTKFGFDTIFGFDTKVPLAKPDRPWTRKNLSMAYPLPDGQ